MGARAWIVILCMGVGSILLFGFFTKLAIDSTPDLQAMIRFKAAFARDFEGRGVGEVSLKRSPLRRGHQLLVTIPKESAVENAQGLDAEIAEYFLEKFEAKPGPALAIRYQTPGDMGCDGPAKVREVEIAMGPFKERLADRAAAGRAAESLYVEPGCLLVSCSREGTELLVEIEAPPDWTGDLPELAREVEPAVRREFRAQPYAALRLRLRLPLEVSGEASEETWASFDPSSGETEVRFDAGGREIAAGKSSRS